MLELTHEGDAIPTVWQRTYRGNVGELVLYTLLNEHPQTHPMKPWGDRRWYGVLSDGVDGISTYAQSEPKMRALKASNVLTGLVDWSDDTESRATPGIGALHFIACEKHLDEVLQRLASSNLV